MARHTVVARSPLVVITTALLVFLLTGCGMFGPRLTPEQTQEVCFRIGYGWETAVTNARLQFASDGRRVTPAQAADAVVAAVEESCPEHLDKLP